MQKKLDMNKKQIPRKYETRSIKIVHIGIKSQANRKINACKLRYSNKLIEKNRKAKKRKEQ